MKRYNILTLRWHDLYYPSAKSFISSRKLMLLKWLSYPLFCVKNVSTKLQGHSYLLIRQCLKCRDNPIIIHIHNITFLYYIILYYIILYYIILYYILILYLSQSIQQVHCDVYMIFYSVLILPLANILSNALWSMSPHTRFKSRKNRPLIAMWTRKYSAILFDQDKNTHVH